MEWSNAEKLHLFCVNYIFRVHFSHYNSIHPSIHLLSTAYFFLGSGFERRGGRASLSYLWAREEYILDRAHICDFLKKISARIKIYVNIFLFPFNFQIFPGHFFSQFINFVSKSQKDISSSSTKIFLHRGLEIVLRLKMAFLFNTNQWIRVDNKTKSQLWATFFNIFRIMICCQRTHKSRFS